MCCFLFFFSSRRRHTRSLRDWSSDVCSSDLGVPHRARLQSAHILITLADIGRRPDGVIEQARKLFLFTDREAAVVQHVLKGWTNKQIALAMTITDQTVKEHIKHIMQKAGTK